MNNWSRYLAIAISLFLIGAVFYYFSDIVAYVLIAWVLSMIGQPINEFYKKYLKLGSGGGAGLTLITFIFLLTGLVWVFVPPMIKQAQNLAGIDYESLVESLEEPINSLNNILVKKGLMEGEIILLDDEITNDTISNSIEKITQSIEEDTIQLSVVEEMSKQVTSAFVSIDSILLENGDTVTKTNITLQVNINDSPTEVKNPIVIGSTVEIKHTDTPIEKIQKRIFTAFNPGQIPQLFSTLIGFMGNLLIAIMSILFIAFFF